MSLENEKSEQNQSTTEGQDEDQSFAGGEEGIVVTEDKPKVSHGTLVMFFIMIVGAAGFYYMYRRAGPSAANAAISKESAEANKTITSFLSGGESNINSMLTLLKGTEKRVQQFLTYPNTKQIPLSELQTNPFRQFAEAPKVAESELAEAAEKKKREEERQTILRAVQGLKLQSIMSSGDRSVCMINSNLYREGQSIDNFTIEKINPTAIVVKNGPFRFELSIQR